MDQRELPDAVVITIRNVDATVWRHCDASRALELPVARALRAPFATEHSFGGGGGSSATTNGTVIGPAIIRFCTSSSEGFWSAWLYVAR